MNATALPTLPVTPSRPRAARWPYQIGRRPLSLERILELIDSIEAVERRINGQHEKAMLAREREMLAERAMFIAEDKYQVPVWSIDDVKFLMGVHAAH